MENSKITIETIVLANKHKVWDYYTRPNHITKWNFATNQWHCPTASNDLQPGGKYSARMEAKDGSFGFDFEAIYNEIVPEQKIVYTLTDGRRVTITLEEEDKDKTSVTIVFDPESENPRELQKAGWQAILDNFKKYTENN